jgi:large exoprotein involved in heme utilization and adhesion
VTGGNLSSINGTINGISGANLYLINPSGIVFGPNATVNVSGSFHISTADYLKMSDGAKFQATNPDASTLSAAPPAAFGFLTAQPAAIAVNGSGVNGGFGVPSGRTLGLVAGPVTITGARLSAPAGTIHVTGVASTGEVPVDPSNTAALTVTSFGRVDINGSGATSSSLNVTTPPGPGSGGSVFIRSGSLTVDASMILANTSGSGPGGQLVLSGNNQITLSNGAIVQALTGGSGSGAGVTISTAATGMIRVDASTLTVGSAGSGNGGRLSLQTGQLTLSNGGAVVSTAQAGGNGSPIAINADTIVADGGSTFNLSTGIFSTTSSTASNAGRGGTITIDSGGNLRLQNEASLVAGSCTARSCGVTAAAGAGGDLTVSVGSVAINSGASLGTVANGSGNAGNVRVTIAGPATIDRSVSAPSSLIGLDGIGSITRGRGNAGNVTVSAGSLSLTNNGLVSSTTFTTAGAAAGNAGSVLVDVSGMLSIDGSGGFPPPNSRTGILGDTHSAGRAGHVTVIADDITIGRLGYIASDIASPGSGNGGNVTVTTNNLRIADSGQISSSTFAGGDSGNVSIKVADGLTIDGGGRTTGIFSQANPGSRKNAGTVSVSAGSLSIIDNGQIAVGTFGPGSGGSISVDVAGGLTIDGATAPGLFTGIASQANKGSIGNAGPISISAGSLSVANQGKISSQTLGTGSAGQITVAAGALSIASNGQIASAAATGSSGKGGNVAVTVAGQLLIDGTQSDQTSLTGISTQSQGSGDAGSVLVKAGTLSIDHFSGISSSTFASGKAGSVAVAVNGLLAIDGSGTNPDVMPTGIVTNSAAGSSGNAGDVSVQAGALSMVNGGSISSALTPFMNLPASTGNGGVVAVNVGGLLSLSGSGSRIGTETNAGSTGNAGSITVNARQIALANGGEIISTTAGTGAGGSVSVTTPGALVLDGAGVANTQIAASATGPQSGAGGSVIVAANALTIQGGAQIASSTAGPSKGGDIAVTVANGVKLSGVGPSGASGVTASAQLGSSGQAGEVVVTAGGAIALSGGAEVTTSTAGAGNGGIVKVTAQGPLTLTDPGSGIIASATSTASGNAGSVTVGAPQITLTTGAEISSTTAGTGGGGSVMVTTPGMLVLDGAGVAATQIAASATGPQSGPGGSVMVKADALSIEGGAQIASSTAGPGRGGDVAVTVANGVTLSGVGPSGASGVTASAQPGSTGQAGEVVLRAGGAIALSGGAEVTTSTAGAGNGGTVQVTAQGPLTLTDPGSGIIASAISTATGNAGSVTVGAPRIALMTGAEIASTTAGTGAGGSVVVTTPGVLALDGAGIANTQIAASATGPQSGPGGSVTVAANALTIEGGAQIASSTAGPGRGGDVTVTVASDIVLPDPGPQITARSTGSGDAGSITVSAVRLLLNNGAAISTEAETSTASGGNITLHVRDFLYLVSSEISTSVKGETGNGGNIAIDPQLVILDHSSIIAQAIEGHGGNITITAGQFIPSSDSIVSASSELGISGTIVINGPRVDVNGALVVLSTQLRGRTDVLRQACAARADRPISSLVEAGRGGLPQDPEATLPALYIAGRDVNPEQGTDTVEPSGGTPLHTTARLTMRCS